MSENSNLYVYQIQLYNSIKGISSLSQTISKARQSLFALVEAAARGEKVEFTHKGRKFYIVAEEKPSKLSRLKPMNLLPPGTTIDDVDQILNQVHTDSVAAWDANNK